MSHSPDSGERSSNNYFKSFGGPPASSIQRSDSSTAKHGPPGGQRDVQPRSTPALPSLATITGEAEGIRDRGDAGSPTPWRPLGYRNILNPAAEVHAAQMQGVPPSPQSSTSPGQRTSHAPPRNSPQIRKRGEPHSPAVEPQGLQSGQGGRTGRRILTPRSPGLRAASLGTHRSPSMGGGLISRVPLPSGEGRGYTAEPGDSHDAAVPPLPPISASARGQLPGLQSRDLVSPAMHASNANVMYSSTGPLGHPQESRPEPLRPSYLGGEAGVSGIPQGQIPNTQPPSVASGDSQSSYIPPVSGPVRSGLPYGQPEFQLAFETQQGPMVVPVNVDFQQASRLADEKRKRNAGASARFRARRKEKEREANQTIAGLQQELQELMDEREFYLRERNFFRDMLARSNPGPLPVRPHSPQPRRALVLGPSSVETSPVMEYGRHPLEMSGQQRHRAGEYQPSLTSQSPSTPYNPPFPPPGPSMALPTPAGPGTYPDSRVLPPAPQHSTSRPPPFDPTRRTTSDRDWSTGR